MSRDPRYDVSDVRTLEAALGRPANAHSWAITDTDSGATKGIYAREELAVEAFLRLMQPGGCYVMTVLHPAKCHCPEVAA